MPRRKPGALLPLEIEILELALALLRAGHSNFHPFGLAQAMRQWRQSRSLTAHGTLYKALSRLEDSGLLKSHWEDPAAAHGRPRRRLYELTNHGAEIAQQVHAGDATSRSLRPASETA